MSASISISIVLWLFFIDVSRPSLDRSRIFMIWPASAWKFMKINTNNVKIGNVKNTQKSPSRDPVGNATYGPGEPMDWGPNQASWSQAGYPAGEPADSWLPLRPSQLSQWSSPGTDGRTDGQTDTRPMAGWTGGRGKPWNRDFCFGFYRFLEKPNLKIMFHSSKIHFS